jgi:DNA ligase-1
MLASVKIDGIRGINFIGNLLSKRMKPIPNEYVRSQMATFYKNGDLPFNIIDGELQACDSSGLPLPYNSTQSLLMTEQTDKFKFRFYPFDYYSFRGTFFAEKNRILGEQVNYNNPHIHKVEQTLVSNRKELETLLTGIDNVEGYMFRRLDSRYKTGNVTLNEGYMMKLVVWMTAEATILDFNESQANLNGQSKNEIGLSVRLGGTNNFVGKGTLGSLKVKDLATGKVFDCSCSSMSRAFKESIWDNRQDYLGKIITYKHKPYGQKDLPRQPQYKSIREID